MASKGFKLTVIAIVFVALIALEFIATNLYLNGESWVWGLGIYGSWIGATILICLGLRIAFWK
jgi:hypothetical protein